jgi:hypothetical protein
VDIEIASTADLDKLSAALKIVSLADAFLPQGAATNTASGKWFRGPSDAGTEAPGLNRIEKKTGWPRRGNGQPA